LERPSCNRAIARCRRLRWIPLTWWWTAVMTPLFMTTVMH